MRAGDGRHDTRARVCVTRMRARGRVCSFRSLPSADSNYRGLAAPAGPHEEEIKRSRSSYPVFKPVSRVNRKSGCVCYLRANAYGEPFAASAVCECVRFLLHIVPPPKTRDCVRNTDELRRNELSQGEALKTLARKVYDISFH